MDFSWNSLLLATFQAKLAIGLCRSEGGEPVRDGGIHWWWPNRRRSGVEIYAATILSHRLFQNPLLLAIILTKLMPWVSVGQWCAFGATWFDGGWSGFGRILTKICQIEHFFIKNFQLGRFWRKLILDMCWALFGRKSSGLLLPRWRLSTSELENPFYLHTVTRFFGFDDFFFFINFLQGNYDNILQVWLMLVK